MFRYLPFFVYLMLCTVISNIIAKTGIRVRKGITDSALL